MLASYNIPPVAGRLLDHVFGLLTDSRSLHICVVFTRGCLSRASRAYVNGQLAAQLWACRSAVWTPTRHLLQSRSSGRSRASASCGTTSSRPGVSSLVRGFVLLDSGRAAGLLSIPIMRHGTKEQELLASLAQNRDRCAGTLKYQRLMSELQIYLRQ